MEYIVFGIVAVVFLLLLIAKGVYDEKRKQQKFRYRLEHEYGKSPEKEYGAERYASIARYFEKHPQKGQVDDITWNDLGMDDVFKRLNDTYSSAGEEILYALLRSPRCEADVLAHREDLIRFFSENKQERIRFQLLLHQLGYTGKFSLFDYLEHLDVLGKRGNGKHWILNALYVPCIVLCVLRPSTGVLCLVGLMLYCILTYFKEKNEIDAYITSFSYVMKLLEVSGRAQECQEEALKEETGTLRTHRKNLSHFKRGAFWLMSPGRMSGSGNPLDILFDYGRMIFHLDLIKFNSMLEQVRRHTEDVEALFYTLGYLEAAIAIGAYRESQNGAYCVPVLKESEKVYLAAENLYHPLIADPVKNSIRTERGILLTGSNASGKSTFLKTVALNAIFAQTIHTVLADSYEGCYYQICSSMALRDNLIGGESYYIVEIRAIKRILDLAAEGGKVLCFVDEVLRGTNTVERIAASTEILKTLSGSNVLCFAATHDVELTDTLAAQYENYHFEEEIEDGDVKFNYRLLAGKATTRNAIKLLGMLGYADDMIENANRRAEVFLQTGQWR